MWCKCHVCLTVLEDFDLHELELVFLIGITTISLQVESLCEVKGLCECASRSVTSTRWDAEGGPLVDGIECDSGSVWEGCVGDGSTADTCAL